VSYWWMTMAGAGSRPSTAAGGKSRTRGSRAVGVFVLDKGGPVRGAGHTQDTRESSAMDSMCAVCGNMSNGTTESAR